MVRLGYPSGHFSMTVAVLGGDGNRHYPTRLLLVCAPKPSAGQFSKSPRVV
jgi:hypothetical protein